jgi:Flp pilus assembly protein TadG
VINRIVSKVRGGSRSSTKQRGQSLVEFAITLPILLIILVGLGELGSALYSYQIVANSAREGARYGAKALHTPDESVAAWTRQAADRLKITTIVDDAPVLDGEKATIVVTRLRKTFSGGQYTYEIIRTYPAEPDPERPSILTQEWLTSQEGKSEQLSWPQGVPNEAMDLIAVEVMYDHPHPTGF